MRQLYFHRAGQRIVTVSHSNLHFLGAQVPLPHICHRLISCSHCSCCQGKCICKARWCHKDNSPSTTWDFIKTATFLQQPNQELQPTVTGEESSHNISGHFILFGNMQSVKNYQQMDTLQPFTPSDQHQHTTSRPTTKQLEAPQQ